jgi:predicted enzyme involved in methoxymalonyl-ACP biosynthesis
MSCRVLGRGVEQALLNEIVTDVLNAGGESIVGIFRPTDRNEMVREHYASLASTK